MKKFVAVLSTTVLTLTLLSGCGSAAQGKPGESTATQPAKGENQAAKPSGENNETDQMLAQFPAVKLPYSMDANAVIAEYQGGKVTARELDMFLRTLNFLNPAQGNALQFADSNAVKDLVRQYVATQILFNRANDKIKADAQKQAEDTFANYKKQYVERLGNNEQNFDKLLEKQGVTREVLIQQMQLINSSIGVLDKDIDEAALKKEYEQADKGQFTLASVRHILISTQNRKPEEALKLANDLIARIKKGEDFAKLAKEYTEDPGSKETGGLYENANVNNWVPEFKNAALTLPLNQISEPPVKTDYGYHIMKVEKRVVEPFEKVKPALQQQALGKAYEKFITTELDKLVTKWNLPEVKPAK